MLKLKRAYEAPEAADGFRVLVDRLWPRGLARERAGVNLWLKEVAPSEELRRWYGHRPERWPQFRERYRRELAARPELLAELKRLEAEHATLTLVYSARDPERNNAAVLKEALEGGQAPAERGSEEAGGNKGRKSQPERKS